MESTCRTRRGSSGCIEVMAWSSDAAGFERFFTTAEPKLRRALVATYGGERGREATAEALAWAWEHWAKVQSMQHPLGYLYRVAQSRSRPRKTPPLFARSSPPEPWVEPALAGALAGLSERQHVCVVLIYGFEWTLREVAELTDTASTTVETHLRRGGVVSELHWRSPKMPELDERIRILIDEAATPVALEEVLRPDAYAGMRPSPRRRRLPWLVASAAAVIVALGVVLLRPTPPARVQSVGTTPSTAGSNACDPDQVEERCGADVIRAREVLGLEVKSPGVLPDGWTLLRSELVRYADPVISEGALVFNRVWTPPREDMTTPGRTPTYIQLKAFAPLGPVPSGGTSRTVVLSDGSLAYGERGFLEWQKDGVYYRIISFGVGQDSLVRFANSLH